MGVKNKLKYLLDARGYTQATLASMLDISLVALNNIINNKSYPSVVISMNMAKVFNVSVEDIFYEESDSLLTEELNEIIYNFDHANIDEKEDLLKRILYLDIQNVVTILKDKNQKIYKMLEFEYEEKEDMGLYERFDFHINFQLRHIIKLMDDTLNDNRELKNSLEKLLESVIRYNQKMIDKNIKFNL